ncbi:PTS cellobiose transporter subunit IIB [Erysipelotrichaceae bacterium RD49]|nr:PTS cellobiose transporter subunit IIB [Erysipelotrichaceae bacterium RD49]
MAAKQALIICVGGMSSSMIAKKTTEELNKRGQDILVEALGVLEGEKKIRDKEYDLFLVSPQTKMYLKNFTDIGNEVGSHVIPIPPQAYIPVPMGINKLADLVSKEI